MGRGEKGVKIVEIKVCQKKSRQHLERRARNCDNII